MYSGDELYGDDVTSPDAADRAEARERARRDWEEDNRESLAIDPFQGFWESGDHFVNTKPAESRIRRIERVLEAVDADNPEGDPSRNGAFG